MNYGLDTGFLVAAELPEHPDHHACRARIAALIAGGDRLSLAPQVLAEFIHAFPNAAAVQQFLDWHRVHRLGRKRLLDTLLAATYHDAGITHVLTLNSTDFDLFGVFTCVVA